MKPGPPQASPQVSPVCLCGGRPGQTTPDLSPTHSHIYSDKRVSCIEGLPLPAPAQLWVVCPGAASITEGVSEKCNAHSPCPPWYVWDRDGVPGREQVISQGLQNERSCISFFWFGSPLKTLILCKAQGMLQGMGLALTTQAWGEGWGPNPTGAAAMGGSRTPMLPVPASHPGSLLFRC